MPVQVFWRKSHTNKMKKKAQIPGNMGQQVKALATKPDDLSSLPKNHMEKGEEQLLKVVLRPL